MSHNRTQSDQYDATLYDETFHGLPRHYVVSKVTTALCWLSAVINVLMSLVCLLLITEVDNKHRWVPLLLAFVFGQGAIVLTGFGVIVDKVGSSRRE